LQGPFDFPKRSLIFLEHHQDTGPQQFVRGGIVCL
jgi:hypothetical protein